jgi:hypothetical protein
LSYARLAGTGSPQDDPHTPALNLQCIAQIRVKATPLLATPPTVTITFPVVAPEGTVTTMLVALQLPAIAGVPLNVTVLPPWDDPKFVPVIVTDAPAGPEFGERLVIDGAGMTVKLTPLLTVPPTVTTTLPVAAPLGTCTVMLAALQLVAVPALVPLKVTVLVPWLDPKLAPVIVTAVPTAPMVGERLLMAGIEGVYVRATRPSAPEEAIL